MKTPSLIQCHLLVTQYTQSETAGQGYIVRTRTHNDNDNDNNMADAKGALRALLLFPALLRRRWLPPQSQNTSAVVWRAPGYQCVNAQTRTHNHTNKLGEVARLNTLSFSLGCYLFFRSVSFSAFVHVTSQASECRRAVCLGLKPHLQTHTHNVARPGVKILRSDNVETLILYIAAGGK